MATGGPCFVRGRERFYTPEIIRMEPLDDSVLTATWHATAFQRIRGRMGCVRANGAVARVVLLAVGLLVMASRSEAEQTIAFTTWRDGHAQIYLMDRDGGNPRNITRDASPALGAAWSPDGRRIAFSSLRDGNLEVYVMDADGGNPRNLTNNAGHDWGPTWAPDGKHIAFTSDRGGDRDIYVMEADGGNPRDVSQHPAVDKNPAWSPNGRWIAFWSEE